MRNGAVKVAGPIPTCGILARICECVNAPRAAGHLHIQYPPKFPHVAISGRLRRYPKDRALGRAASLIGQGGPAISVMLDVSKTRRTKGIPKMEIVEIIPKMGNNSQNGNGSEMGKCKGLFFSLFCFQFLHFWKYFVFFEVLGF